MTRLASAAIRSSRPNFPSRIKGDALITQTVSDISQFRIEFSRVQLDSSHFATAQLLDKIDTSKPRYFRRLTLGNPALGVPLHRCRRPHLDCKVCRGKAQRGKNALRQFDG